MFFGGSLSQLQKKQENITIHFFINKDKESFAILSQIRIFDAKRLQGKKGRISQKKLNLLKEKIKQLL